MQTQDFDYDLPEARIAQHPADRRDAARMMVLERDGERISHHRVSDLPAFLAAGDAVVTNDTKVIPARVMGRRASGGRVECLFVEPLPDVDRPDAWLVMMKASNRPKPGTRVHLPGDAALEVLDNCRGGANACVWSGEGAFDAWLEAHGAPPLPPYIRREAVDETDVARYQTMFAVHPGAVAAPTAGLHFTPALLDAVRAKGVAHTCCTLHVGPGTFRPVKVEDPTEHRMDAERYRVPPDAADLLNRARERGGRILAVGSTVTRTLETVVGPDGRFTPGEGRSDLFIYPPFTFRAVDRLLTNFHLPKSTLLMMVSAFAGHAFTLRAYREAVDRGYRFYSYGDCMLIL